MRTIKLSTLPYGRTRDRRCRVKLVNCDGSILVLFPLQTTSPNFEITIEVNHSHHQGREQLGVPLKIRQWIEKHPRSTPQAQQEDVLCAIAAGEIQGVSNKHLNRPNIHYWWRKVYKEKTYVSDDPWKNVVSILEQHPLVSPSIDGTNIRRRKLFSAGNHRAHLIWFVHQAFEVDPSSVREVFIDATYNMSKKKNHLYAIMAQELGYSVPLAFMLMEIHDQEDPQTKKHEGKALQCNINFYRAAKEFGIEPAFAHTDKDWSEISAVQVHSPQSQSTDGTFHLVRLEMDMIALVLL